MEDVPVKDGFEAEAAPFSPDQPEHPRPSGHVGLCPFARSVDCPVWVCNTPSINLTVLRDIPFPMLRTLAPDGPRGPARPPRSCHLHCLDAAGGGGGRTDTHSIAAAAFGLLARGSSARPTKRATRPRCIGADSGARGARPSAAKPAAPRGASWRAAARLGDNPSLVLT